jgi:adenylate kinase
MLRKYEALLLIGLPGSGKSTQGKILGSLPGIHYWEASETFRAIDADSEIGRLIHQYISRGELIPDELAVPLCLDDLKARVIAGAYHPATDMLVFDGIPRTVKQAALLDERVKVMKILYLVCDDIGQVIQRLRQRAVEQGRADDATESIIRHRLEVLSNGMYCEDRCSEIPCGGFGSDPTCDNLVVERASCSITPHIIGIIMFLMHVLAAALYGDPMCRLHQRCGQASTNRLGPESGYVMRYD